METSQPMILKASEWRWFSKIIFYVSFGVSIGGMIPMIARDSFSAATILGLIVGCFIGPLLLAPFMIRLARGKLDIEISPDSIVGPASANIYRSTRNTIPVSNIDRERTTHRSLWAILNGWRIIWSKDGKKIYVDNFALGKTNVSVILETLGLAK